MTNLEALLTLRPRPPARSPPASRRRSVDGQLAAAAANPRPRQRARQSAPMTVRRDRAAPQPRAQRRTIHVGKLLGTLRLRGSPHTAQGRGALVGARDSATAACVEGFATGTS